MNKEAKILIGITIATILVVVGGSVFFSSKGNSSSSASPDDSKVYDQNLIMGDNPHTRGSENPKVTIVEFGDFECPACGASYPVTEELMKEYGDKIKFVFREFPLQMHAHAYDAARAAEASGAQGKFWEMYNKLYSTQADWDSENNAHSDYLKTFEKYAGDIGLDVNKYKDDMSKKTYDSVIQKGLTDGTALGIQGTPTFFVNGKMIFQVLSLDQWKNLLSDSLK